MKTIKKKLVGGGARVTYVAEQGDELEFAGLSLVFHEGEVIIHRARFADFHSDVIARVSQTNGGGLRVKLVEEG